jgi:hypothetical protein
VKNKAEPLQNDPIRDEVADQNPARLKALKLLCEILPPPAREEFLACGYFQVQGDRMAYRIFRNSQTEIYLNGSLYARACLQLTIPAPSCDRMIAEYLILRNDEALYWRKANIEPVQKSNSKIATVLVAVLDFALLVNLLLYLL